MKRFTVNSCSYMYTKSRLQIPQAKFTRDSFGYSAVPAKSLFFSLWNFWDWTYHVNIISDVCDLSCTELGVTWIYIYISLLLSTNLVCYKVAYNCLHLLQFNFDGILSHMLSFHIILFDINPSSILYGYGYRDYLF